MYSNQEAPEFSTSELASLIERGLNSANEIVDLNDISDSSIDGDVRESPVSPLVLSDFNIVQN